MFRIEHRDVHPCRIRRNPDDRDVTLAQVKALRDSMAQLGYVGDRVVVRPDMQHLDGQHRVYAARLLSLPTIPVIVLHGPLHLLCDGWQEYVAAHPDGHAFNLQDVRRWPYRDYGTLTADEIAEIHDVPAPMAEVIRAVATGAGWEFAAEDGELLVWPEGDHTEAAMTLTADGDEVVCYADATAHWVFRFAPTPGQVLTELETAWDEVMS